MRITTRAVRLRAVVNLAMSTHTARLDKHHCQRENVSSEFLEQIFYKLKKAGVIRSVRGPGGGFVLARKPEEITVKTSWRPWAKWRSHPCTLRRRMLCDRPDPCSATTSGRAAASSATTSPHLLEGHRGQNGRNTPDDPARQRLLDLTPAGYLTLMAIEQISAVSQLDAYRRAAQRLTGRPSRTRRPADRGAAERRPSYRRISERCLAAYLRGPMSSPSPRPSAPGST